MVEISISEYETDNGRNPFGDWHHDLEPMAYARVARALARIVDDGNFGDSKSVGKGARATYPYWTGLSGVLRNGRRYAGYPAGWRHQAPTAGRHW